MMKRKKLFIIFTLIVLFGIFGITYAFFEYYKIGDNSNKLVFGNIYLKLDDGTDTLKVSNVFPETKEEARDRKDNLLTFTIAGLNTTEDNDIWYQIDLVEGEDEEGRVRVKPEHLVFDLIEVDADNNENLLADAFSFEDLNSAKLWVDIVNRNTTSEIKRTYKLRMWLSEDVFISDTNPKADYSTDIFRNGFASVKVSVYGDFNKKVSHNLNYNAENYYELTDADSSGARYLYGDINDNYLWYSGKLWRIVGINSDDSIKIITDNSMTMLAWSTSNSNISYTSSQARTWLNNEFYPTLYDANNLLVNHAWDYTIYNDFPTSKPTTLSTINEKVGLLSIYDFMMTGGTTSSSTSNTFLEKNHAWWTSSANASNNYVWYCYNSYATRTNPTGFYGIRPVINLVPNLKVKGNGTIDNPFVLDRDIIVGVEEDKLNTRISGEYISFNDTIYRIIGVEKDGESYLTKVVFSDTKFNKCLTLPNSQKFGSGTYQSKFSTSYGIGLYLNNWYNASSSNSTYADFYIKENYKKMIATNSSFYYGYNGSSHNDYNYQDASSYVVNATIGLGRYGEIFMANDCGSYTYIWLMTTASNDYVKRYYSYNISNSSPSSSGYVRPVFYLKDNVVIGDVDGDGNAGNGMMNSPYEIIMDA